MSSLARALATWFGCGLSPVAPGTAGSAGALVVAIALHRWLALPPYAFALLAGVAFLPSVWAADVVSRLDGKDDPQHVVVDEVLGQWITLAAVPRMDGTYCLAAFGLFRLFDIWKPFPVRRLERLHGGLGIIADDLGAGVYGALVLLALGWFNR